MRQDINQNLYTINVSYWLKLILKSLRLARYCIIIYSFDIHVCEGVSTTCSIQALKIHWWVKQTKACSLSSDTIVLEANAKQVNKYMHAIFLGSIKEKKKQWKAVDYGEGKSFIVIWVVRNYLVKWRHEWNVMVFS